MSSPQSWPLTPSSSSSSSKETPASGFSYGATTSSIPPFLPAPTSTSTSARAAPSSAFTSSSAPAPSRQRTSSSTSSSSKSLLSLASRRSRASSSRAPPPPASLTPPPSPPLTRSSPSTIPRTPPTPAHRSDLPMSAVSDAREADEDSCPICLEALSLRLAGEKPHVVPVCGHRLHHSCFTAVYGDVNRARARTSGSLGLCGVCRREMKVGDGGDAPGKGSNKFAKLSGLPSAVDQGPSFKMRSATRGNLFDDDEPGDDGQDDELVQLPPLGSFANPHPPPSAANRSSSHSTGSTLTAGSAAHRSSSAGTYIAGGGSTVSGGSERGSSSGFDIVKPIVTVRAEHTSVERPLDPEKKTHLTCCVSIECPSRYPAPLHLLELDNPTLLDAHHPSRAARTPQSAPLSRSVSGASGGSGGPASVHSIPRSSSPTSLYSAYAYGSTPGGQQALAGVIEDLQQRMDNWKGHEPGEFGQLRLYDHIQVRKDKATREFLVYLFEEAILCVTDDRRKGVGKLVDSVSGHHDKLRLKGRVYLRHVAKVVDTSKGDDDLSLTITMTDDAVASFVMLFRDRSSLETWRAQIEQLLVGHSPTSTLSSSRTGADGRAYSHAPSSGQSRVTTSAFSGHTRTTGTSLAPSGGAIPEEDETGEFGQFAAVGYPGYASSIQSSSISSFANRSRLHPSSSQNALNMPRTFPSLDLMLILSVPTAGPAALKTGILKNALEFLLQHVGPRTRISIVTYSAGEGSRGVLRKTPFLAVGKLDGKKRLERVVDELGCDADDLTSMVEHKEERVNVVTACNLALDIVLQRKAKSALTGMVLLNDGRDGAQKQQLDLVLARSEAANVPIHAIGYGRSHDPSSLWLLSNHSAGSYTFVKELYDLRDALAGVVGGILSVAATNVRLHIRVPEKWLRIRKVSGTPGAIVSRTGTDVDVEVGELRFGERKDLIVEVEMALGQYGDGQRGGERHERREHAPEFSTATDAFFLSKAGIDPSTLDEYNSSDLYGDDVYDQLPEEAPLFEVNAAYRDPAAGKQISRLNNQPCLLTVTVNPTASSISRQPNPPASAPEIVCRRMELLVSDMLSRALLLMTRRNDAQAARLLEETKRIISTISASLHQPSSSGSSLAPSASRLVNRRSSAVLAATALTHKTLAALAEDVDAVHEACQNRELFETSGRYLAAQQAVVLRDQRAWTNRTASERLMWRADNSLFLVGKSQAWLSATAM
ncbi:hypothetical protein JCM8097_001276 [Rhodosporidiobolus ruineniae]